MISPNASSIQAGFVSQTPPRLALPRTGFLGRLMHLRVLGPFLRQQFLNRLHDPEPHGFALHVTGSKTLVGPHGRFDVGCFAVLLNQLVGGPANVEVGGHGAPEFTFETCRRGSLGELPQ